MNGSGPKVLGDVGRWAFGLVMLVAIALQPKTVMADNLGAIVYLLIWPINALLLLVLLVFGIVTGVKLKSAGPKQASERFSKVVMLLSVVFGLGAPLLNVLLDHGSGAEGGAAVVAISSGPVTLVALVSFLLGRILLVRSRRS